MKKTLLFLLLTSAQIFAQVDTCWTKTYGGTADDPVGFGSGYFGAPEVKVAVDSDGNIWVGSSTNSSDLDVTHNYGGKDIWILKLNPSGDTILTRVFGGTQTDALYDLKVTPQGNILISGYSASNDNDFTNNKGIDDGIAILLDSDGNVIWNRNFGGQQSDFFYGTHIATDGFYFFGGTGSVDGDINDNANPGSNEAWILKTDVNGNIIWSKTTSALTNNADYLEHFWSACSIPNSSDILLQGVTGDFSDFNTDNIFIARYTADGNRIWLKEYGCNTRDIASGIIHNEDGNFISAGMTTQQSGDVLSYNGGQGDFWLLKIDGDGNLINERCLGGTNIDYPYSIINSPSGSAVVFGITNSSDGTMSSTGFGGWDFWCSEINPFTLDTIQTTRLGGSDFDYLHHGAFTSNNKLIVAGRTVSSDHYVTGNNGGKDIYVACLNDPLLGVEINGNISETIIYPNPFKSFITISNPEEISRIVITTTAGKVVYSKQRPLTNILELNELDNGVYLVYFETIMGKTFTTRLIKIE